MEKFYNKSRSSGSKSVLIAVLRAFDNFSSEVYGKISEKLHEKLRGLGKLGRKEIEHINIVEKDGRLYYSYKVLRTKKLASAIISNQIDDIGKIKEETREVNLNGDDKRFWLGRLENINDGKMNNSTSLNPEFFAEKFELNDNFIEFL